MSGEQVVNGVIVLPELRVAFSTQDSTASYSCITKTQGKVTNHDADASAMTQLPGGCRAMAESEAAQSVDTLRCLISHASPSGTKVSR